jgi:hypothetical protein
MTNRQAQGRSTTQADCRWHGRGQGFESPKLHGESASQRPFDLERRMIVKCDRGASRVHERRQPSPWLVLKGLANPGRPSVEIDVLPRQPKHLASAQVRHHHQQPASLHPLPGHRKRPAAWLPARHWRTIMRLGYRPWCDRCLSRRVSSCQSVNHIGEGHLLVEVLDDDGPSPSEPGTAATVGYLRDQDRMPGPDRPFFLTDVPRPGPIEGACQEKRLTAKCLGQP